MSELAVHPDALPAPLFERLLRAVREVGDELLPESYQTTFWYARGAQPRNLVEEAIVRLSELVAPGPECVGVEWWLGRLPPGKPLPMHYDRDIVLEKQTGKVVSPLCSSILYLNEFPSSPTLVLDPVMGQLIPRIFPIPRTICPTPNHYAVYRGNLYHGVIANQAPDKQPTDLRLTVLINYWDRRPLPPICRDWDGSVYRPLRA